MTPPTDDALLRFYRLEGRDPRGRTLTDIWRLLQSLTTVLRFYGLSLVSGPGPRPRIELAADFATRSRRAAAP